MSIKEDIEKIDRQLEELPKGTLTYKNINGKKRPYLQRTVNGKSVSTYIKIDEQETVLAEIERRESLQEEKRHLVTYLEKLSAILKDNPTYVNQPAIGYQDFEMIREMDSLYVDKTAFIEEWFKSSSQVTLITRPRRFGKTLLLSTIKCFLSTNYANRKELFDGLYISKKPSLMYFQGTYPVISISFGSIKGSGKHFENGFRHAIYWAVQEHEYLLNSDILTDAEKTTYKEMLNCPKESVDYSENLIKLLSKLLYKHHNKKVFILIDEYDTPLTEAYVYGDFDKVINTYRNFINSTIKGNEYLKKALIIGITKISKNSLFSDMNNIEVCTCTSDKYATAFGFTEQEVMNILECQNIDEMAKVKQWYDGFIFGGVKDIYNPWSIVCFLDQKIYKPYWINTSGNDIIGKLIRGTSTKFKSEIERLIQGEEVHLNIDENLALQYLEHNEAGVWSLLLAVGYIKASNVVVGEKTECDISITNYETKLMFERQVMRMFDQGETIYEDFTDALLGQKLEELNLYMKDFCVMSMSYFDVGTRTSQNTHENFYHGLVLGLIAALRKDYIVTSNRESGFGRYDIAIEPKDKSKKAFIIEFKLRDEKSENSLEETTKRAFKQIEDKKYEADLIGRGFEKDKIVKYAFAFEGKEVLVEMC